MNNFIRGDKDATTVIYKVIVNLKNYLLIQNLHMKTYTKIRNVLTEQVDRNPLKVNANQLYEAIEKKGIYGVI